MARPSLERLIRGVTGRLGTWSHFMTGTSDSEEADTPLRPRALE